VKNNGGIEKEFSKGDREREKELALKCAGVKAEERDEGPNKES